MNALACLACKNVESRAQPIDLNIVGAAQKDMLQSRATHLDQLVHKLKENRVRRVIKPMLSGKPEDRWYADSDVEYVKGLGLIRDDGGLRIANPIYHKVIPRELMRAAEISIAKQSA